MAENLDTDWVINLIIAVCLNIDWVHQPYNIRQAKYNIVFINLRMSFSLNTDWFY